MKLKCFIGILSLLLVHVCVYAQDLAPIQIQKVEGGRTEAVVPGSVVPKEKPTDFAGQGFYYFEAGILKTARFTSSYVGKVTDGAVWGIQKISEPIFSPIIKALDVKRWANKKQASRDRI